MTRRQMFAAVLASPLVFFRARSAMTTHQMAACLIVQAPAFTSPQEFRDIHEALRATGITFLLVRTTGVETLTFTPVSRDELAADLAERNAKRMGRR